MFDMMKHLKRADDPDKIWRIDEFREFWQKEEKRCRALHPRDPEHWDGFIFNEDHQGFEIWWGDYEYFIEFDRIKTHLELIQWLEHLTPKAWKNMTALRVHRFIQTVFERRGWELYPTETLTKQDKKRVREKMTPVLRYAILARDGFRCVKCGMTPATGAVLHVDHCVPVSRGGETVPENLQTLCACCNFGKRND